MPTVETICQFLDQLAPPDLAEPWDNVGLLVGDPDQSVRAVMTCLTVTPDSAAEAIQQGAQLIVAHHPLPFRPLKRVTTGTTPGRLLLKLIGARIALYSPHTAFDSAAEGINRRLAEGLGLSDVQPLVAAEQGPPQTGSGRWGRLAHAATLSELAARLKQFLSLGGLRLVGDPARTVQTVGVACGSAGQRLEPARRCGCEALVTGETSFHTCLEAEATGIALLLPGHYASERFAVELLAQRLAERFGDVRVWASRRERDPLRWI